MKFSKDDLLEKYALLWGPNNGAVVISDTIVDHTRWSVHHEIIFTIPGMEEGTAWRTRYSISATESQDEVDCDLVRKVSKVIEVWE